MPCKTNIIKEVALDEEFTSNFPLLLSTFLIFKKTPISIEFLKEWNRLCLVRKYIDGEPYGVLSKKFKWSTPEQSIMSVIVSNWVYEGKNNIPKTYPNFMINNTTRDFDNYLYPSDFSYLDMQNTIEGFGKNTNDTVYYILIGLLIISLIIHFNYTSIILILCVVYLFLNKSIEGFENINIDIGNMLSIYYYTLVKSIINKEDFKFLNETYIHDAKVINEKNSFLDHFPKYIKWNESIYNELINNNITPEYVNDTIHEGNGFWKISDYKHEMIHKIMKRTMNDIFNEVFIKLNLKKQVLYPVIHFRCADTPFNKFPSYHFQKYDYFNKALSDIEKKIGIVQNVTILACFDHLSNEDNKKSCNRYVQLLKKKLNYTVHIECNSNVDDFVTMFYAPAVISTTSSFSFMAGYFGNGIFIQPNMLFNDIESCTDCSNIYKNYNISHDQVKDYHDIDEVYKLLNS